MGHDKSTTPKNCWLGRWVKPWHGFDLNNRRWDAWGDFAGHFLVDFVPYFSTHFVRYFADFLACEYADFVAKIITPCIILKRQKHLSAGRLQQIHMCAQPNGQPPRALGHTPQVAQLPSASRVRIHHGQRLADEALHGRMLVRQYKQLQTQGAALVSSSKISSPLSSAGVFSIHHGRKNMNGSISINQHE